MREVVINVQRAYPVRCPECEHPLDHHGANGCEVMRGFAFVRWRCWCTRPLSPDTT